MLNSGTKLGSYEVVAQIGAGGMGEVYRARDTRLDRIVAIKVLPAHLADKPELRERFEREARTIASLNHPHICTLYDIGRQDGMDFLVMEYLEGETLAQRLQKGPLPLEQVLQFAIEIADALDKAHRKGVTHRDLKPGNIMLTESGSKLLDFGLAKLRQEAAPATSASQLPTASVKDAVTQQGAILGTLQYMAPEQVEGKQDQIDARTDIFAFGIVVYEMATGKKAFAGQTQASVMAKILESDPPPMASLQPMTPPALDRVVRKCLAKQQEKRWQDASDLCDELKWIAEGGTQIVPTVAAEARGSRAFRRRPLVFVLGALVLGALVSGVAIWNLRPAPSAKPVTRTIIALPPGDRLPSATNDQQMVAISPDGSELAYVAIHGRTQQLYLRGMNSLEAKPVPGTEDATNPFFSPTSQWLGFFVGGKLKKVSVAGGAAVTLGGDVSFARGGTWSGQGSIIFTPTANSFLQQISDSGGALRPVTHFEKGEATHRWPEFLPDGRSLLFAAGPSSGNWANSQVVVQSLGTGERRSLIQGGTNPRYALSGHLLYAQAGTLMAAPFDAQRLQLMGSAVPVLENVLQSAATGAAQYSLSATGSLVYISGGANALPRKLVWVTRNGVEQAIPAPPHSYNYPRLSPDGRRVSVTIVEQESQTYVYDLARDALARLTFGGNLNQYAVWSPDGKRVAFSSNRELGPPNVFWEPSDGSGGVERLTTSEYIREPNSFSPDGQSLAFTEVNPTTGFDIWILRLDVRKAEAFIQAPSNQTGAQFSPDGHWLAYNSDESGHSEVYVQSYPGPGGKWQISTEGGTEPVWNRNGRELFYRIGDNMMVVEVTTQPSFSAGKPRTLFAGPYLSAPGNLLPNYDVSGDGQRFLMIKAGEEETALTQIVVVQNWFEELKQKVPAGKK